MECSMLLKIITQAATVHCHHSNKSDKAGILNSIIFIQMIIIYKQAISYFLTLNFS